MSSCPILQAEIVQGLQLGKQKPQWGVLVRCDHKQDEGGNGGGLNVQTPSLTLNDQNLLRIRYRGSPGPDGTMMKFIIDGMKSLLAFDLTKTFLSNCVQVQKKVKKHVPSVLICSYTALFNYKKQN